MDAEELQELLGEFSLKQIAGWYGVSQRGIEKWCRTLGIAGASRGAFTCTECESISTEEQK
ncbi:MAG: hypothetical protein JEZ00_11210 [Anaerolineaceae bacterium]|nr:hypothetical protein [Anaerolineaceae bacterium]